eukprot:UN13038
MTSSKTFLRFFQSKIDDVTAKRIDDVSKVLTSLQFFLCQKVDIELINTS